MGKLKNWLKARYIGWDYDKYWSSREALFDPKTNKIKYFMCKSYVSKTNRRYAADIAYDVRGGNNFKGRPILGHKLNGIVIAAGAIIGKNCYISHQVTIGRSKGGLLLLAIMFIQGLERKYLAAFTLVTTSELVLMQSSLKMYRIMQQQSYKSQG